MNLRTPAHPFDLRRSREQSLPAAVLTWADFLAPADRAVLVSIFRDGQRVKTVAATASMTPDSLRKRIRRLLRRVVDPEFQAIARHLGQFPPESAEIARRCILHGHSVSQVATELRLAPAEVRRQRRLALPLASLLEVAAVEGQVCS
jgi:hypothetical protein